MAAFERTAEFVLTGIVVVGFGWAIGSTLGVSSVFDLFRFDVHARIAQFGNGLAAPQLTFADHGSG